MASQLAEALGKQITFVDIPEAAMRSALLSFGLPEWQADGLVEDYAHYRRGEASAFPLRFKMSQATHLIRFWNSRATISTCFCIESLQQYFESSSKTARAVRR